MTTLLPETAALPEYMDFLHLILPFSPAYHNLLLIFLCPYINPFIICCFALCSKSLLGEERRGGLVRGLTP